MNKEDAEKEADRINSDSPDWFCPVIKGSCMPSCYCYQPARTYRPSLSKNDTWHVVKSFCTNASMIGSDA